MSTSSTPVIPTPKKLSNAEELVLRLVTQHPVGYDLARAAFWDILNEHNESYRQHYMAMILNGMLARSSDPQEIAGLLDAIFEFDGFNPADVEKLDMGEKSSITLAGSGKKGFKTVNITSLTAFVLSCMDVCVAKICAPSTSSTTGSQDFAERIGANLKVGNEKMKRIMKEHGIGFFSVTSMLPKFSSVYTGHFYSPHALIFAIAPLAAPFKTDRLIFGLAHPDSRLALTLMRRYDRPSAFTVGSTYDGLHFVDEAVSLDIVRVDGYGNMSDKDSLLNRTCLSDISGVSQAESMKAIAQCDDSEENIIKGLAGLTDPESVLAKEIALSAATTLHLCHNNSSMESLYTQCREIIRSGDPVRRIEQFVEATGGDTSRLAGYLAKAQKYDK